jgi:hypothetical protein
VARCLATAVTTLALAVAAVARPVTTLALAVAAVTFPVAAAAQPAEVHGATATFAASGLVVVWAILRAPTPATPATPTTEDAARVVVRVAAVGPRYRLAEVNSVDPFTGARELVLPARLIGSGLDVQSPRAGFADHTRRELHLYATEDDARAGRRALTVYYLGVPDTTPEFSAELELRRYLDDTVAATRAAAGGAP